MKFSKQYLEELDLPYESLENRIVGHTRWSVIYEVIFEIDGKFYRTTYSVGATENQDEEPWEYQDEVECEEVEKKWVSVEQWVTVDSVTEK